MLLNPPLVLAGGCLLPLQLFFIVGTTLFVLGGYRRTRERWAHARVIWIICWLGAQIGICGSLLVTVDVLLTSYGIPPLVSEGSDLANGLLIGGSVLICASVVGLGIWYYALYAKQPRDDVLG